jgi:cytochrome c-type biogenesis protein
MLKLFTTLSQAVEGEPTIAIGAAFVWGILSVLLSPCHLTSIPLIIGYLSRHEKISSKKAFVLSAVFSTGILISVGIIGGITAAAGRIMGDIGRVGNYAVALVFLFFGLNLLGIFQVNWPGFKPRESKRQGYLPTLFLGLVFGLALGPCTFAFMAPMLGVIFQLTASNLAFGVFLLAAFGLGHITVITAAGTSSQWVQRMINWEQRAGKVALLRKICGVLVILGGIYLAYSTF